MEGVEDDPEPPELPSRDGPEALCGEEVVRFLWFMDGLRFWLEV